MQLSELLDSLDCSTMHIIKNGLEDREFSGATLLSSKMASTLEDAEVVFFSPASYFNMLPEELRHDRAFFLYLNEPVKPLSGTSFVATVYEYDSWLRAFEAVAQEFRLLQKHKEQVIGLTGLINDDAPLHKVLDVASEIMGAPASVMDNSYTFLAVSSNFPEFAAHGEEKTSKTLPSDAFALLKSKGLLNPNRDLGLVVFDWNDAEGNTYTNHFVPVKSGDDIIGSLSFLTKGGARLRPSRANMLPTLAQLVSLQLQRSESFVLNKTLFYAHIFKVLQGGEAPKDADRLAEQFSLFSYKLKRYLQVFYVDLSRHYLPITEVEPLADQLKRQITNSVYTFTKTGIIFLASTDEPSDEGSCRSEGIERALGTRDILIGVSDVFTDPSHFPYHLAEAERAIGTATRLGRQGRIASHSKLILDEALFAIDDPQTLYGCQFAPVLRLLEADKGGKGGLMQTLWCYLENPDHPAEVASRLFIHKNTLYFRLDKIRKIMGCDFRDGETIAKIILTFHVLHQQNVFKPVGSDLGNLEYD